MAITFNNPKAPATPEQKAQLRDICHDLEAALDDTFRDLQAMPVSAEQQALLYIVAHTVHSLGSAWADLP